MEWSNFFITVWAELLPQLVWSCRPQTLSGSVFCPSPQQGLLFPGFYTRHFLLENADFPSQSSFISLNSEVQHVKSAQTVTVQPSALPAALACICILMFPHVILTLMFPTWVYDQPVLGEPAKGCNVLGCLWCNLKAIRLLTNKNKVEAQKE